MPTWISRTVDPVKCSLLFFVLQILQHFFYVSCNLVKLSAFNGPNFIIKIMAPSIPRRALIAVTSAEAPLHQGHPTGVFIGEAMHPFNVFRSAGFEVDISSETGKYHVDWLSEQPSFLNGDDVTEWKDLNSEFRKKLDHMPKAEDVDSSKVCGRPLGTIYFQKTLG